MWFIGVLVYIVNDLRLKRTYLERGILGYKKKKYIAIDKTYIINNNISILYYYINYYINYYIYNNHNIII